ncbi:hypothetical protein FRB95_011875 [Tulasnella sp. JGI-2019a]|nr:hypothetical protein FRB95_011875 [Tulasnella sp. JGI-2019a]
MACSRITKRKLDDAIEKLDDVLNQGPTSYSTDMDPPSPTKRANTTRTSSIYASLSKYNLFRSNSPSPRSLPPAPAARPISQPFALASKAPYRPDSSADFLDRLATYKLTTYKDKPSEINAVAASKAGWVNEGKERLVCGYCSSSWSLAATTGMSREAASTLIEKQRSGLVANHKDFCPWKRAQCDDSVYRIPLRGPTALAKELKGRADAVTPLVNGVLLKHPLTDAELASLTETMDAVVLDENLESNGGPEAIAKGSLSQPSETAILCVLFGWDAGTFIPPNLPSASRSSFSIRPSQSPTALGSHAVTPSPVPMMRAGSVGRHSLSLSKASGRPNSGTSRAQARQSLPAGHRSAVSLVSLQEASSSGSMRASSGGSVPASESLSGKDRRNPSGGSMVSSFVSPRDGPTQSSAVVSCQLCLRRVGLWSFQPIGSPSPQSETLESTTGNEINITPQAPPTTRPLDLIKEHRTYCPYVTKSTVLPIPVFSVPLPSRSESIGSTSSLRKSLSSLSSALSPSAYNQFGVKGKSDDDSPIEGWRAILTIVNRAGMGLRMRRTGSSIPVHSALKNERRKQGLGRNASVSFAVPEPPISEASLGSEAPQPITHAPMDVDGESVHDSDGRMSLDREESRDANMGVEKIVQNVKKTREGSRELLRYVKDLLRRSDPGPSQSEHSSSSPSTSRASLSLGRTRNRTSLTPPRNSPTSLTTSTSTEPNTAS